MYLAFLLIFILFTSPAISIDCGEDRCFGNPQNCDSPENCQFLFNFDTNGNLDLHLKNFTLLDSQAYAAFRVGEWQNETCTFLLCLPHAQKMVRAISKLGDPITVVKSEIRSEKVKKIDKNQFVCSFSKNELFKYYQHEQWFFVSTGVFNETEKLVIVDGEQLYAFHADSDGYVEYDYEYEDAEKNDIEPKKELETSKPSVEFIPVKVDYSVPSEQPGMEFKTGAEAENETETNNNLIYIDDNSKLEEDEDEDENDYEYEEEEENNEMATKNAAKIMYDTFFCLSFLMDMRIL